MPPRLRIGAVVAAERLRRQQQRVQPAHRAVAVVRVAGSALAHRDQRPRDRVLERPLRQDELRVGARRRSGRRRRAPTSLRDHRQPGPGMRGQVLLADAHARISACRPAAGCSPPAAARRAVAQPHLGLQRRHAVVVRQPARAAASAGCAGARPGRLGPGHDRRLVGHARRGPSAASSPPVAPHREPAALGQVAVGLEARRVERAERLGVAVQRQRRRAPLPPVTLTVRRAPAGTDTVPPSGLRKIGASRCRRAA